MFIRANQQISVDQLGLSHLLAVSFGNQITRVDPGGWELPAISDDALAGHVVVLIFPVFVVGDACIDPLHGATDSLVPVDTAQSKKCQDSDQKDGPHQKIQKLMADIHSIQRLILPLQIVQQVYVLSSIKGQIWLFLSCAGLLDLAGDVAARVQVGMVRPRDLVFDTSRRTSQLDCPIFSLVGVRPGVEQQLMMPWAHHYVPHSHISLLGLLAVP